LLIINYYSGLGIGCGCGLGVGWGIGEGVGWGVGVGVGCGWGVGTGCGGLGSIIKSKVVLSKLDMEKIN